MKYAFIVVILGLALSACSKDSNPVSSNDTGKKDTSATVLTGKGEFTYSLSLHGQSFDRKSDMNFTQAMATVDYAPPLHDLTVHLTHTPSGLNGRVDITLGIIFQGSALAPGTYTINSADSAFAFMFLDTLDLDAQPGGTITITKFDTANNLVSGTARFRALAQGHAAMNDSVVLAFNDVSIYAGSYGQGTVTATLDDGTKFTAAPKLGGRSTAYLASPLLNIYAIVATATDGVHPNSIVLYLPSLDAGHYALSGMTRGFFPAAEFQGGDGTDVSSQNGATGTLTISSSDPTTHRINGTFEFSGPDQTGNIVHISNGVIDNLEWFNL